MTRIAGSIDLARQLLRSISGFCNVLEISEEKKVNHDFSPFWKILFFKNMIFFVLFENFRNSRTVVAFCKCVKAEKHYKNLVNITWKFNKKINILSFRSDANPVSFQFMSHARKRLVFLIQEFDSWFL